MPSKRTRYKGFLSRAETMEWLGVDRDMLETYIRNGHLERVIPPGRKQGYFRVDQVNSLTQELQAFRGVYPHLRQMEAVKKVLWVEMALKFTDRSYTPALIERAEAAKEDHAYDLRSRSLTENG